MAQVTRVELIDDLDGSAADETIRFGIDGKSYVIDLKTQNVELLRAAVADFVAAARRDTPTPGTGRATRRATRGTLNQTRERNQKVRAWARDNGYTVSERGRIPAEIAHAYTQNH